MENLPLLYQGKFGIEAAKLKDVIELVANYVPPQHLWFCEQFAENRFLHLIVEIFFMFNLYKIKQSNYIVVRYLWVIESTLTQCR